jgi:hypothetical protein
VIIAFVGLAAAVAALAFVVRNSRKTRRLQRQAWADIALTEVRNSATGYYMRRTAEIRDGGARGDVAVDPLPRPLSDHCRPGRCLALTCCSYECSQGRCPSIPEEFRTPGP